MEPTYLAVLAGTVALAMLGAGVSFGLLWSATRTPGIARILYLSLMSLKVWSLLVMAWFVVLELPISMTPGARQAWRAMLVVYLLVQVAATNVALARWAGWREWLARWRRVE